MYGFSATSCPRHHCANDPRDAARRLGTSLRAAYTRRKARRGRDPHGAFPASARHVRGPPKVGRRSARGSSPLWLVVVLVRTFGSNTSDNLELPGTDSQAATDLLAERFPPQQNGSSPIVFHVESGQVTDSKNKQAIEASHAGDREAAARRDARPTRSASRAPRRSARTSRRRSSPCCSTSAGTS